MNADAQGTDTALLDLVSFKWLMAGCGWWVNLSRMQRDPAYVKACALCGLESGHALLERRSAELLAALGDHRSGQPMGHVFAITNTVRII